LANVTHSEDGDDICQLVTSEVTAGATRKAARGTGERARAATLWRTVRASVGRRHAASGSGMAGVEKVSYKQALRTLRQKVLQVKAGMAAARYAGAGRVPCSAPARRREMRHSAGGTAAACAARAEAQE